MIQNTSFEFSKSVTAECIPMDTNEKERKKEMEGGREGGREEVKERREGKKKSPILKVLLERKMQISE